MCQTLGARTLKAQVDHELVIPEQSRYVVPVTFGAIEQYALLSLSLTLFHMIADPFFALRRYWYDSRYAEALDALGLLPDGTPKDEGVDPRTGEVVGWTPSQGELVSLQRRVEGAPKGASELTLLLPPFPRLRRTPRPPVDRTASSSPSAKFAATLKSARLQRTSSATS